MVASRSSVIAIAACLACTLPLAAANATDVATPASDAATEAAPPAPADNGGIIVTARRTRSVLTLQGAEIQKIMPGASPLKAIQTLPGVTFMTADPWGNNEQNISLFIHGFSASQLGYTMDGIPLGDQTYGNYNGLSPQRAIISEDVGRVTLASGAGDLGTASTSNLGGTIDTYSSDPKAERGATIQQTFGSYSTFRTYARVDSGTFGNGNSFYVSGVRQDAKAWDFDGHQGGYQADAKFVHDDATGKLTLYALYSDKAEPNEDASVVTTATQGSYPYTRPFYYPDFAGMENYLKSGAYAAAGSNYRNYYSDAQRTDYLAYAKYDWHISDRVNWSNQAYYHHDDGVGVVAGPINVAGLPGLFAKYFPTLTSAQLSTQFGGSGLATRTTEYRIDREGVISTLTADLGNHHIEAGGWYEHQSSSSYRRWYALDANDPSSPYTRPGDYEDPEITQYGSQVRVEEYQTHIQDNWHVLPTLTLMAGFKSTFQDASQKVPVQPIAGSFTGSTALPVGKINTSEAFLPQAGLLWDATPHEQIFVNAQKNVRQFQTSASSGLSPFALGSQEVFDDFKNSVKPETSWTYEAGARTQRALDLGPITGFEGQISYYHVDFKNRLLALSPTTVITSIISGAAVLQNVGSVKTDGVDIAGTLHFGRHFSIYDAVSYNNSRYEQNYQTGLPAVTVLTKGKKVPGSPDWLNKFVVSGNYGIFDAQLSGDYIGKRYATYTNDLSAKAYFTMAARIGATIPMSGNGVLKQLTLAINVTNLTDKKAASTLSIGAASGTYNAFPLPPRQVFGTIGFGF
ncbi:TonB-dependent receptor [Sphingomonas abietis]|uniref:TonB-dependent receptor plug domain-containing protein n=1 Tax=Sphingomonas abietis TaxID=3012344 RepID=A0ABY7NR99_9SPHN|nr:TonB-dependent receptor plug domain-containing protein [Sphingomonas abietis]WBO24071.1 TonB-dependent receptor plug domain-containing protein [Sphingomonas abietis]